MSSPELKNFIDTTLRKELEESTHVSGLKTPNSAREQLTRVSQVPAQILVQDKKTFYTELDSIMDSFKFDRLSNSAKSRIWKKWDIALRSFALQARTKEARTKVKELQDYLAENGGRVESRTGKQIPKRAKFYVITSYGLVRKLKGDKTQGLPAWVIEEVEKKKGSKVRGKKKEALGQAVSAADQTHGYQLGHGEYGEAASAIQVTRAQQKVSQSNLSDDDKKKVNTFINKFAKKLKITIDHKQVLDANGTFSKDYFVLLSVQRAELNQADAKDVEENAMNAFRAGMDELLAAGSSTKLRDAIAQVILRAMTRGTKAVAGSKLKITGPVKPKDVIKEQSKGSSDGSIELATAIHYSVETVGKQLASTVEKEVKKTSAKRAKNPMSLIGLINAKLPKEVVGNMGAPALENVTGRFAGSVRAVNILQHKQYPTIQYTYQKHPYQIFEGTEPWSDGGARDPKRLIEQSIREIAAELAIARFHVQRV